VSRARAVLKVAAVGFSVALAGGLISYRAGAFDWLTRPEPQPTEPEPHSANDPTLFDGSKSGRAITVTTVDQTNLLLLSGSKSAMPVIPPAGSTTTPPPKGPTILPGSKVIAPVIPPPNPPAQSPQPPK